MKPFDVFTFTLFLLMVLFLFNLEYLMFERYFKESDGFYHENLDYYGVYVGKYSTERVNRTDCHEYCHYLVKKDFNHFCQ